MIVDAVRLDTDFGLAGDIAFLCVGQGCAAQVDRTCGRNRTCAVVDEFCGGEFECAIGLYRALAVVYIRNICLNAVTCDVATLVVEGLRQLDAQCLLCK